MTILVLIVKEIILMKLLTILSFALTLLACTTNPTPQFATDYPSPIAFTDQINAYLAADEEFPPAKNKVVVTGSSSIRFWQPKIYQDFTKVGIISRGFGGSDMNNLLYYSEQLISKHQPRAVVIYEGDNDIANGIDAVQIAAKFNQVVQKIRLSSPQLRVYFISIKPSFARWPLWSAMVKANQLIEDICNKDKNATYIDVASVLLSNGEPLADIFQPDGLHLNAKGYQLWAAAIVTVVEAGEAQYE